MTRSVRLLGSAFLALSVPAARATDLLLLQQTVLPDETAPVLMQIDRQRPAVAQVRKDKQKAYLVEITLVGQPAIVLSVRCQDLAGARQLLDALRPGGSSTLDVSGRCRF
jgi:hypothetical protein